MTPFSYLWSVDYGWGEKRVNSVLIKPRQQRGFSDHTNNLLSFPVK